MQDERVQAIIEPILAGEELPNVPVDDIQHLLDLGLCSQDDKGGIQIANPFIEKCYREY